MLKYLRSSLWVTLVGLGLGAFVGWESTGSLTGTLHVVFIVLVLSLLEVSLSFDNAVVNATVLRDMDLVWRRRFITWGILIAVVGMRVVLPLVLVAILGKLSPVETVVMAVSEPDRYSQILSSAHISVSAFGGAFLAMVGLKFFFDHQKDVHWVGFIERPLSRLGRIEAVEIGLVLLLLYLISRQLGPSLQLEFLVSGVFGLLTYIAVDGLGALLQLHDDAGQMVARSGFSSFMYLEVLDASFSFDGVIGAFALSTNLFVIAIGLGIGAMFVRSLTILFVETGTLARYRYLEHGAFWALIALAVIMFLQALIHVPEVIAGLVGAVVIVLAFYSSVRHNRAHGQIAAPAEVSERRS